MVAASLVDIATAIATRGRVDVIGVVVDALSVGSTKGTSMVVSFELKDDKFDLPAWDGSLKIKYFNNDESKMPHAKVNDVLLLRGIKVRNTLITHEACNFKH